MTRQIYVPGIGQYDNIGDIILRRQLLRWLAPLGHLHVMVGDSPPGYAEALGLDDSQVVYRSFSKWYRSAFADAMRGRAAYVFKPGEIQITIPGLKEHVAMVPLQAVVKARRGPVIRIGAGARGFGRLPRALMRPSLALTDLTAWRDARTADFLGTGEVMPDLAFGEGDVHPRGTQARSLLIVSMRSDRPVPSDAWFCGIRSFATAHDYEIVAIVQVERDDARSRLLAERLDGTYHPWSGDDHEGHEEALRALYRRAAIVVSDRLHVLITSCTEGAVPSALLVDDSDKIERHFSAAGIPGVAVRTSGASASQIEATLEAADASWPVVDAGLTDARLQLAAIRTRVDNILRDDVAPAPARRLTVWHLGRRGEVAGGMTQVVNAYLAWPFPRTRVRLLATRNGTKGLSALALFAAAFARLPFLGRRDRTVIAVHLSQGGSFVREGTLLKAASRLGYRTVAHLHGSSFVDFASSSPDRVALALAISDAIVALSEQTRDEVLRLVPHARVELVPNAVPEGRAQDKQRVVVFGGGVTRRKGVDVLVEAWRRIAPDDGWELKLVGPVLEDDLVSALPDGASRLGAVDHGELMELLDRSAIAVLPSRDEAMPMFLLEAMARRNAVVSTTVGGIPTLLSDGAGVLVPPGDVDALADALTSLIRDDDARTALADAGYVRYAADFSADAVYPRVEDLWLSVLEPAPARTLETVAT